MNEEGVSICITAYHVEKYIKDCLDSVVNQTWFKTHNDWEIIVGVDGCEKTLSQLKTIMNNYKNLRVFMMDSNKGTYITSNTIMSNATYENIFRFDGDDIMYPELVEKIMTMKGSCSCVRYLMKNFGGNTDVKTAHGAMYIKKSIFLKYGGFRPWVCGADTEIYHRLKNIEKVKDLKEILMLRRVHEDSLTNRKETNMKSEKRQEYIRFIKNEVISKPSDAVIQCEKNTYKEIFSEIPGVDKNTYMKNIKVYTVDDKIEKVENSSKTVNAIKKLRDDIQSGRIIKIPTGHGFIWRRVK